MFERCEQIRTETPLFAADGIKISALEEDFEETLGKVLGFLERVTLPPNESIKRSPVTSAKLLQPQEMIPAQRGLRSSAS